MYDDEDFGNPYEELEDLESEEDKIVRHRGPLDQKLRRQDFHSSFALLGVIALVSLWRWQDPVFRDLTVSGAAVFERGEWWRIFSALFIHSDPGHLLGNSPLILFFGAMLSRYFGWRVFPVLCILVGAAANLGTIFYYPPNNRLLGASGMLYGIVAMWLVLYIRFDVGTKFHLRIMRATAFSLIVLFPTTFQPNVSYLAHGLGFLIGLAVVIIPWPLWRPIGAANELSPDRNHNIGLH